MFFAIWYLLQHIGEMHVIWCLTDLHMHPFDWIRWTLLRYLRYLLADRSKKHASITKDPGITYFASILARQCLCFQDDMPPSILMTAPLMKPLSGLKRKATNSATSSASPSRRRAGAGPAPNMSEDNDVPRPLATSSNRGVSIMALFS